MFACVGRKVYIYICIYIYGYATIGFFFFLLDSFFVLQLFIVIVPGKIHHPNEEN